MTKTTVSAALIHAARTAAAATVSLAVARLFRLPEAQWAAISTLVVTQSTLGASWTISAQRLAGTALGAAAAAIIWIYLGPSMLGFAAGVFLLGLICAGLRLDRAAYRFSGITLAIVLLVSRDKPAWIMAAHRFFEVSLGIAAGLLLAALWPERERPAAS
ncbi:MAG TPA: FUSC family protein [Bryobacteraceae bacterium]|nr:FUSC family protein [Bryobacteraceae bacterium]